MMRLIIVNAIKKGFKMDYNSFIARMASIQCDEVEPIKEEGAE